MHDRSEMFSVQKPWENNIFWKKEPCHIYILYNKCGFKNKINIMKHIKVLPCMNSYYSNKNCIKYFKVIKKSIPVKLTSIRHLHVLPAVVVSFSCCCAPYRRGSQFCVGGDEFLPPTDSRVCRVLHPSCLAPVTGSAVSYKHTHTSIFSNVCCKIDS